MQKHVLLKQQTLCQAFRFHTAMMFLFRDVKVRQRLHDSRVHKATAACDCASPESLLLRRAASGSEKEAPPLITLQNQLTNVPSTNTTISFFFLFISKGRGQRVKGQQKAQLSLTSSQGRFLQRHTRARFLSVSFSAFILCCELS